MAASTITTSPINTGLLIGGEEIRSEGSFPVINPAAPGEVVGYAASATREQSEQAVHAATRAWPSWSTLSPQDRADRLVGALEALGNGKTERAEILVRENGKVRSEAEIELDVFEAWCRLAASLAPELDKVRDLPPPTQLAILAASLPYALVAENPVIVKPPPTAPLAVVSTLRLLTEQLPAGVLNVVTGSNEAVAPLIQDSRVDKIVFTGSTPAGRYMMKTATENMIRVTLELGGNDPAIVLDDAQLDDVALQRLAVGSFLTTGQVCMAIKRVYVHRSRYDELVTGLSDVLSGYRIGNGLEPQTTMGPLNNARQREIVRDLCSESEQAGREVRKLGTIAARGFRRRRLLPPRGARTRSGPHRTDRDRGAVRARAADPALRQRGRHSEPGEQRLGRPGLVGVDQRLRPRRRHGASATDGHDVDQQPQRGRGGRSGTVRRFPVQRDRSRTRRGGTARVHRGPHRHLHHLTSTAQQDLLQQWRIGCFTDSIPFAAHFG
jgi:acyl-CoA reductase-like NAD-dependent aldehyde dehydrogenase